MKKSPKFANSLLADNVLPVTHSKLHCFRFITSQSPREHWPVIRSERQTQPQRQLSKKIDLSFRLHSTLFQILKRPTLSRRCYPVPASHFVNDSEYGNHFLHLQSRRADLERTLGVHSN